MLEKYIVQRKHQRWKRTTW